MSSDFPELQRFAFTYPAIDNHAHPLLRVENRDDISFEGLVSEAQGDALTKGAIHTLACYRATHQLAELLGLPQNATWEDIKTKRSLLDYLDLCRLSFNPTRIQSILIDDGLRPKLIVHDIAWHNQFTHSPARRIVRIETVAEAILENIFKSSGPPLTMETVLSSFMESVAKTLNELGHDAQVVGYKSVVCYRTGLAVSTVKASLSHLCQALEKLYKMYEIQGQVRLAEKAINDAIVQVALDVAARLKKPVQFHTGLGDNDMSLALSSPAHLQPIIKAFPKTTFVLLHSSYPYTRDAGYLTAVYSNVYLDFGEVFPIVSGHGQRSIIRQVLELTPTNKIMWSSDAHFWPESYYLGALQARQALYEVLSEIVRSRELTEAEAVMIIKDALFHNANRVYNLGLEPHFSSAV